MTATSKTVVADRLVVHAVGQKTQTVRIHTSTTSGVVEAGYSFPMSADVSLGLIDEAGFEDIDSLREWLVERDGIPLGETGRSGPTLEPLVGLTPEDDDWIAEVVPLVEQSINALLDDFLENPYLHRVEHSLHAELFALLKGHGPLARLGAFDGGRQRTQLVHKEWPETIPRPEKKGLRGSFDLALLAPTQLARANRRQFRDGRVEAPIVIELGLDYDLRHLTGDDRKFRNSGVRHPYLVHFGRAQTSKIAEVENFIRGLTPPVKIAYGHVEPESGSTRFQRVGESEVSTHL